MTAQGRETGGERPGGQVYAEDVVEGTEYELGDYPLSADEIRDFAQRWDPQTEASWTVTSFFGEPIASGLHAMSIAQLLAVRNVYRGWAVIAGRGFTDVRFRSPAKAGTLLSGRLRVERVQLTDAAKGIVVVRQTLHDGPTPVLVADQEMYLRRRPGGAGGGVAT